VEVSATDLAITGGNLSRRKALELEEDSWMFTKAISNSKELLREAEALAEVGTMGADLSL
jgi:hypothetical protein